MRGSDKRATLPTVSQNAHKSLALSSDCFLKSLFTLIQCRLKSEKDAARYIAARNFLSQ